MDHIAKALPDVRPDSPGKAMSGNAEPQRASPDPIRRAALRRLWARMASIYGYRWNASYDASPEDDAGELTVAGDTWQRGLLGVTERQVAVGISACIASSDPWPPTLPEFRALCLGVPTFAAACWQVRCTTAERTPFAVLMWGFVDGWLFGRASTPEAEKMLRTAYEMAREWVMVGNALPPPAEALPPPPKREFVPANPEVVERSMREIAEKLAVAPAQDDEDQAEVEAEARDG